MTLSLQCYGTPNDDQVLDRFTIFNLIHDTYSGNLSQSSSVQDNLELSRRQATSKTKVFVRLFFNGKEVCQSSSRPVSDDFMVPFGHIFPLRIVQWPESLRLQVQRYTLWGVLSVVIFCGTCSTGGHWAHTNNRTQIL